MNNIKLSKDIICIIQKYNLIPKEYIIIYRNENLENLKRRTRYIKNILDNFNTSKYRIESSSYNFRYSSSYPYEKRYTWALVNKNVYYQTDL